MAMHYRDAIRAWGKSKLDERYDADFDVTTVNVQLRSDEGSMVGSTMDYPPVHDIEIFGSARSLQAEPSGRFGIGDDGRRWAHIELEDVHFHVLLEELIAAGNGEITDAREPKPDTVDPEDDFADPRAH